jgi:hypothetical protein
MPSYDFQCKKCGTVQEIICRVSELDNAAPICCSNAMSHVILAAPMFSAAFLGSSRNEGYVSPLTGNWICSQRARKQEMLDHNVIEKT